MVRTSSSRSTKTFAVFTFCFIWIFVTFKPVFPVLLHSLSVNGAESTEPQFCDAETCPDKPKPVTPNGYN